MDDKPIIYNATIYTKMFVLSRETINALQFYEHNSIQQLISE